MGLESAVVAVIVDDEPGNRDIVACNLMGLGYQVEICGSGEEAIDRMDGAGNTNGQIGQIDLLLTDLEMPETNGIDVAERFRERYPGRPVILMTASDVKVPEGLIDARLRKPFSSQQLIKAVQGLKERSLILAS